MAYIDWHDVIDNVKKYSITELTRFELLLQRKSHLSVLEEAALRIVQVELRRRNGL